MKQIPKARKEQKELKIHGHTRIDNYYWLNQREDPKVIDYLSEENEYTKTNMSDTDELQENLFKEITGRIKQDDRSVPYFLNKYYYYTRYEEGKEYPVYCRKKGTMNNKEEVLLDVNQLAEGHDYYHVSGLAVSPDNKMLSFGADNVSRRIYTLFFKNLESGEILEQSIEGTSGSACWANDNQTVFYSSKNEHTLRTDKIFRYRLFNDHRSELVYEEKDDTYYTFVFKSRSRQYILIGSSATLSDEYRILSADNPDGDFRVFQPRQRGLEYSIRHFQDKFYVQTNLEAKNFRLMETPVTATDKTNWKEVIPHREEVLLENFINFDRYMVLDERIKGNTNLRILDLQTGAEHNLDFGEEAYTAWISTNPEVSSGILRFGYSSLTTPSSIYDYDMATREKKLLKRQEVTGGHNPENYQSRRVYATAADGKEIAVSMVYGKGTPLDGSAPLLLYAYGSYGHTIDPSFGISRLSLLGRGFIYAIAHVRGGQFYGRTWYEEGKLLKKRNTLTDFICCARYLTDNSFTSREKLFAMGGSAGGLLMGAVANESPDLFKGIIAAVPFVDVLTTMLDDSIPLTTGEYDEWGNPNDKTFYEYMLSYSPYDNVKPVNYPNMLVTSGLHDSQVQYWEPAKWVARLRDLKTDENLLLLHTNMEAGHGGASGRFRQYRETALEYAFLLKLLGIKE